MDSLFWLEPDAVREFLIWRHQKRLQESKESFEEEAKEFDKLDKKEEDDA